MITNETEIALCVGICIWLIASGITLWVAIDAMKDVLDWDKDKSKREKPENVKTGKGRRR